MAVSGFLVLWLSNTVSALDVDFGEVVLDTTESITLELRNDNDVTITILCNIMNGKPAFSTQSGTIDIPENSMIELEITFTPSEEGTTSDELRIYSFASVALETPLPQDIILTGIVLGIRSTGSG